MTTAFSGAGVQGAARVPPVRGPLPKLWQPLAAVNALKASTGMVAAWYICLAAGWPQPFMAPIAVLVLQTPYLGASVNKGVLRVLGTLAGALLVLGLLAWLIQDRWALIAALSLVLGIAIWRMANSPFAYAWFMLAITVAVIAVDASLAPAQAFQLAVYRTSEAVVGVLVALTVNAILWPQTGGHAYRQGFAAAAEALAAYLRRLGAAVEQPSDAALALPPPALRGAPVKLREILAAAALDSGTFRRLRLTFEAQIQGLSAVLGSLMAVGEGLRLALAGEHPTLRPEERALVRSALDELATVVEDLGHAAMRREAPGPGSAPAAQPLAAGLVAARLARDRLFATPAPDPAPDGVQGPPSSPGRDTALRHAAAWQLEALIAEVQRLVDSSSALANRRSLPPAELPPAPPPSADNRLAGLPQALTAVLTFWLVMLLWIETQWPPVGTMGVLAAVVVIGIETLVDQPFQQPGRRVALGAALGVVVTAPVYALVLPRLDGFGELALVLLPLYWVVLYLFNAMPPPNNRVLLGTGLVTVIMLRLGPEQGYDTLAWIAAAFSLLTGYGIGVAMLGIVRGTTPQEALRRRLLRLLGDLDAALTDLADPARPDFAARVHVHEQVLRLHQQALAELAPIAYAGWAPANDPARIRALIDAVETLAIRFRALHRARLGWRMHAKASDPAGAVSTRPGHAPLGGAGGTRLGARWRGAFTVTLHRLRSHLKRPYPAIDLGALDALRPSLAAQLDHLAAGRGNAETPDGTAYLLAVHGHYVGVARALRATAQALQAIDWAQWRRARF